MSDKPHDKWTQAAMFFKWDHCDFSTSRKAGDKIHKSKKHDVIEQLDGKDSDIEEAYAESYWEREYMGTSYQTI